MWQEIVIPWDEGTEMSKGQGVPTNLHTKTHQQLTAIFSQMNIKMLIAVKNKIK
jgi:hypothetical protein